MNIEPLEPRVAPATLTGQILTYTDIDGDHVAITISKGTLTPTMFTFDTGSVNGDNSTEQQLQLMDLSAAAGVDGANITMKVTKANGGDGLAAVGRIDGTLKNFGVVSIKGDLGDLECGTDSTAVPAAKSVTVRTTGAYGLVTQGGSGNLAWNISGDVGFMKVLGDVKDTRVNIFGALGPLTIGGSLIGGSGQFSGAIGTLGGFGPIKIGKDVRGGTGFGSGLLSTEMTIDSITIGGSLIGGDGTESGELRSVGNMGPVKIGGDERAGTGDLSGRIDTFGNLARLTIGGSLIGGIGDESFTSGVVFHEGQVFAVGDIGPVRVGRDLLGGAGFGSGEIRSHGAFASITVGGSLLGGAGIGSSQIASEAAMGPMKIGGSLFGGPGLFTGIIHGYTTIESVKVGGSLVGSAAQIGGYVECDGSMGNVTVVGSLLGSGSTTAAIFSGGSLGAVKIGGSVEGGTGTGSGFINASGDLTSLTIGGSLAGGTGLANSGAVMSAGKIGAIKIGRDLIGGSIANSAPNVDASGYIESAGRISSVTIGGSIITGIDQSSSGQLTRNAGISAGDDIGSLTVKGNLIGNVTTNGTSLVVVSARGSDAPTATSDLAIGKINIGGRVELAQVLAGYTRDIATHGVLATNGNAQIGAVKVGGDWVASSLVAGIKDTNADGFGNADDAPISVGASIAKIASISIKGITIGSAAAGDHFGFESHAIGSFKSLGFTASFTGGADLIELSPLTDDLTIREI